MELSKDVLEYLVKLGKDQKNVEQLEYDGRKYTRQEIKPVEDPLISPIKISTLSSLIDLCSGKFVAGTDRGFEGFEPKAHVVHVVSHKQVQVVTAVSNAWGKRAVLIDCTLTETEPFTLGQFLTQDKFLIAVLSCFVQNEDRNYVAKLAGNAMAENVTTAQDDGVSQQMGTRAGATLADRTTVKNIVTLQLYRTFREVVQPASEFLFRLQQSGDGKNIPLFAFFEADGGRWKLTAVESIARFLRAGLTDATVVS